MTIYAKEEDVSDGARHEWATRFSACPECGDDESADHSEDTEDTASADDTVCIECAGTRRRCDWCGQPPPACTCQPERD